VEWEAYGKSGARSALSEEKEKRTPKGGLQPDDLQCDADFLATDGLRCEGDEKKLFSTEKEKLVRSL